MYIKDLLAEVPQYSTPSAQILFNSGFCSSLALQSWCVKAKVAF